MKRQVAITGPTPEFLRWSIRRSCLLRRDTETDSVDQTEKRLRAIRAAGSAITGQQTFNGIAVRKLQGQWKGFRLNEVFQLFGGQPAVETCCGECPANLIQHEGHLAGCYGWLPRISDNLDVGVRLQQSLTQEQTRTASRHFMETNPLWYGLWADRSLNGEQLPLVLEWFEQTVDGENWSPDVRHFVEVLRGCVRFRLTLDVELVPPGNSDGLRWTISPHCDRCKAPATEDQNMCVVCKKPGRGHPEIHRRVLGLRPWIDLAVVVGAKNVESFLQENKLM